METRDGIEVIGRMIVYARTDRGRIVEGVVAEVNGDVAKVKILGLPGTRKTANIYADRKNVPAVKHEKYTDDGDAGRDLNDVIGYAKNRGQM